MNIINLQSQLVDPERSKEQHEVTACVVSVVKSAKNEGQGRRFEL